MSVAVIESSNESSNVWQSLSRPMSVAVIESSNECESLIESLSPMSVAVIE